MAKVTSRFKHAWNAFMDRDSPIQCSTEIGEASYRRPDRIRVSRSNEKSIVTAVLNRIALDCASMTIEHVRLDEDGRYLETIDSGLNECLTLDANKDQTGRSLIQDFYISLFDDGVVALVPTETDSNPFEGSFDVFTMRTGKIVTWYPSHVKVNVYNDDTGRREDRIYPKNAIAIVENPFATVMNEPNSVIQRLIRKLNLLDIIDEQSSAGKLDLIIQLPYVVKTEARRQEAEKRRKAIEDQLSGTKYGIAYTDGTEHITQLNRPVSNNLMTQIEFLTDMMYSQLGITSAVMDGSADEKVMLNYFNRTIEPLLSCLVDEMKRKFLTKTARSQRQSLMFFREPFKLVTVGDLAEIGDKFTRNEIMTSNELRQIMGYKPSNDPKADELRNSNLNQPDNSVVNYDVTAEEYAQYQNDLDEFDNQIDELERMVQ